MVVFVDLEGDDDELHEFQDPLTHRALTSHHLQKLKIRGGPSQDLPSDEDDDVASDQRQDGQPIVAAEQQILNFSGFSAALSCYPVVTSLARHLDLNDLHSLARTCRQFRCNLLQFRHQLLSQSLHCTSEATPLLTDILQPNSMDGMTAADMASIVEALDSEFDVVHSHRRVLTSRIGRCARDLVAACRRCGTVVCRNCAIKPPSNSSLRARHRRLCSTCKEAPLWMHTLSTRKPDLVHQFPGEAGRAASTSSSLLSTCGSSSSSCGSSLPGPALHGGCNSADAQASSSTAFTASAFAHDPCTCVTRGVYLCQSCGQSLRSSDITYERVWTWRSRYSTHIGGLGTGMGAGEQGQKCGRGEQCLDAVESEVEIDCSERPATAAVAVAAGIYSSPSYTASAYSSSLAFQPTDAAGPAPTTWADSPISSGSAFPSQGDHDLSLSAGYLRQEVEGIGGVVKKKVKKRVRVGATVCEFDEERSSGKYLEREASGQDRSWCGWCDRVVVEEEWEA